jgi:HEAT repeat protein
LSEWLRHGRIFNLQAQLPKANIHAIRQIGTNGLPCLLEWIEHQSPPWPNRISYAVKSRHIPFLIRLDQRPADRARQAVVGFWVLGPQASAAIPGLSRLLDSPRPEVRGEALSALSGIGKDAIPALLDVLTNRPAHTNLSPLHLSSTFYGLGTNASLMVPVLIQHLRDDDPVVSEASAYLLGMLGMMRADTDAVIPALCADIEVTNVHGRWAAVNALGYFGERARPVAPVLIRALHDSDEQVRTAAMGALRAVAPEVLGQPAAQ